MPDVIDLFEMKRKELGETQEQFAKRLGTVSSIYSKIKKGKLKLSGRRVAAWGKILGIDAEYTALFISLHQTKEEEKAENKGQSRYKLATALLKRLNVPGLHRVFESFLEIRPGDYLSEYALWTDRRLDALLDVICAYEKRSYGSRVLFVREAINTLADTDEERTALAIVAFPLCGYVYEKEEMPALHEHWVYLI